MCGCAPRVWTLPLFWESHLVVWEAKRRQLVMAAGSQEASGLQRELVQPMAAVSLGSGTSRSRSPSPIREMMEQQGYAAPRRSRISGKHVEKINGVRCMTAMVKQPARFTIEAYDVEGNRREEGGDPFLVAIRGGSIVRARCEDHMDGTYTISYLPAVSGHYTVSVSLYGTPLVGSPFPLTVLSPIPDPLKCKVYGAGLSQAVAREPTSFEIEFIDAFGQITRAEEIDCYVELIGDAVAPAAGSGYDDEQSEEPSLTERSTVKVEFSSPKLTKAKAAAKARAKSKAVVAAPAAAPATAPAAAHAATATAPEAGPAAALAAPPAAASAAPSSAAAEDDSSSIAAITSESSDAHTEAVGVQSSAVAASEATERSAGAGPHTEPVDLTDGNDRHSDESISDHSVSETSKALPRHEDAIMEGIHARATQRQSTPSSGGLKSNREGRETNRSRNQSPKGSHRRRDPYGKNPHGRRDGPDSSTSPRRFRLDASERQQHMTLWNRRLSTEGVTKTKPLAAALGTRTARDIQAGQLHSARRGQVVGISGPSYAHELSDDPTGVAFAFGGVEPGNLHAGGKLVRVHQVHYSIGRAGVYRLHVGLRQQSCMLADSPFELHVRSGAAHFAATHLCAEDLPLRGVVGKVSKGIRMITHDRMSNRCLVGGAPVRVACSSDKVSTNVIDKGDGTYLISWHSDASGKYMLHVTIEGQDVRGSPAPLTMFASSPQVSKFQVTGRGLDLAIAGKPAVFRVECQDDFGNLCDLSQLDSMKYGVAIVPIGGDDAANKKKSKSDKDAVVSTSKSSSRLPSDPKESMPFEGKWVEGFYVIQYVAQKAGNYSLHAWCTPSGAERERLPGSPFNLTVKEGQAHASGCFIKGARALREQQKTDGPSPAGQEITLHPQLRDQFGNPASASEGSLTASLEGPFTDEMDLNVRAMHSGIGSYEVTHTPEIQGEYTMHIRLNGVPISDSPVAFSVRCGAPNGAKSHLIMPTEQFFVGSPIEIILQAVDKYGNKIDRGGANVSARAAGNAASACTVDDNQDGTYTIHFSQNAVGDCKVIARIDNMELAHLLVTINKKEDKGGKTGRPAKADGDISDRSGTPQMRHAPAPADLQRSGKGQGSQRVSAQSSFGSQKVSAQSSLSTQKMSAQSSFSSQRISAQSSVGSQRISAQSSLGSQRMSAHSSLGSQRMSAQSSFGSQQSSQSSQRSSRSASGSQRTPPAGQKRSSTGVPASAPAAAIGRKPGKLLYAVRE